MQFVQSVLLCISSSFEVLGVGFGLKLWEYFCKWHIKGQRSPRGQVACVYQIWYGEPQNKGNALMESKVMQGQLGSTGGWSIQSKKCLCYIKSVLRKMGFKFFKLSTSHIWSYIELISLGFVCVYYRKHLAWKLGLIDFLL